ncbi:sensor histidine kinase [Mycobacterium vicinigordonae]|uniref:histidine kinase n=1 Tax=Mycobacterium vicinigordonae TaxID=1719132 RepID=A0A7D6DZ18_9MYCO|nr:histidine kinase [Mycobacterium vicinigordonae]QLL08247.1 two-component sensor histidine kinase [Mycobacterium vicinigordonae]
MKLRPPTLTRQRALNGALIALAATDTTVSTLYSQTYVSGWTVPVFLSLVLAAFAVGGLFFRNRAPYIAFALTIPATALSTGMLASQLSLVAVAQQRQARSRLTLCALTAFVCYTAPWAKPYSALSTVWAGLYGIIFAIAPISLGLLMRARADLAGKLAEIERVRQHEEHLLIETALARERADLAREMHDVVSHQVSLIAVQAGALQVTTRDEATAQTARTIRALSVQTLDELRQMVGVLRAASSNTAEPAPPPGIDNVAALVAASGVPAVISTRSDTATVPPAAVQRVIYRAVQEGLTNVTKHAPGATATVELKISRRYVRLTMKNTHAERPPDELPGAQHGLLGLRERAELLGGTLSAGHLDGGGYELSMTLPMHV